MDPTPQIVRRTFGLETVRSVAVGVQETAFQTFAILIALKHFESGPAVKSLILSSQAIGLIGSLFIIPWVQRSSIRLNHAAAGISFVAAIGFIVAALSKNSEIGFLGGMSVGFICMALPMPLQTQLLRQNYPDKQRGRLFSITILARAISAMAFSYFGGQWLEGNMEKFPLLLICFAAATLVSTICFVFLPSPKIDKSIAANAPRVSVFNSMRWLRDDAQFRIVIFAAMAMGFGFLPAIALRVEYLANPVHGISLDIGTIAFLTGVLPSLARMGSTFFWGWLFDRMQVFRLRGIVNLCFLAGILTYFTTPVYGMLVAGSIIFGIARGGGEILWNLWVTKLAKPEHVGEYMSVHTFLTGIRALIAPFFGFYLADLISVKAVVVSSSLLIGLSVIILIPLMKRGVLAGGQK